MDMETASGLKNRYWVLRHGKSVPNERGLVVSSLVLLSHLSLSLSDSGHITDDSWQNRVLDSGFMYCAIVSGRSGLEKDA